MTCNERHEQSSALKSLSHIVRQYKKGYSPGAEKELRYYKIQKRLEDAIEKAALSRLPSGKRHSHQRRIPESQLIAAKDALLKENLKGCKSFHELFEAVEKSIGSINKISELAIYDISHRIGAYLGLEPEFVYIHAGTRVGAKALKIRIENQWLPVSQLPMPFHTLKPYEIEDCLCIFKKELQWQRASK